MNRIYLIGFMGVGKSTIGKNLARKLSYDFADIDDIFENKYKISIDTFFRKYGEDLFRELENKILKETFNYKNTVISTGGGSPCYQNAIDQINENGLSIYLRMPVATLVHRLENSIRPRPLIQGKNHEEIVSEVTEILSSREKYYNKANIIYDAISTDVDDLMVQIKQNKD